MVDLNGHEAGNGGHSQGKPTAYRDSSTRRDEEFATVVTPDNPPHHSKRDPKSLTSRAHSCGIISVDL
jgi:hypothetical protein